MLPRILVSLLVATLGVVERTHAAAEVSGVVFEDANRNGTRDANERGIANVAVSNQDAVVATDANGAFRLPSAGSGVVFVSTPNGYRAVGDFWKPANAAPSLSFGLTRDQATAEFTFIHAS